MPFTLFKFRILLTSVTCSTLRKIFEILFSYSVTFFQTEFASILPILPIRELCKRIYRFSQSAGKLLEEYYLRGYSKYEKFICIRICIHATHKTRAYIQYIYIYIYLAKIVNRLIGVATQEKGK